MTKRTFDILCDKYGDPNLPADEKWKSIKSFHTTKDHPYNFNVADRIARGEVAFVKMDDSDEYGFVVGGPVSVMEEEFQLERNNSVTVFPLNSIMSISFIV